MKNIPSWRLNNTLNAVSTFVNVFYGHPLGGCEKLKACLFLNLWSYVIQALCASLSHQDNFLLPRGTETFCDSIFPSDVWEMGTMHLVIKPRKIASRKFRDNSKQFLLYYLSFSRPNLTSEAKILIFHSSRAIHSNKFIQRRFWTTNWHRQIW